MTAPTASLPRKAGVSSSNRLEDAESAGDKILAVIAGVGFLSDGKGTSMLGPNPEGQAKAVRRALEQAEVDPTWIDLVEAAPEPAAET